MVVDGLGEKLSSAIFVLLIARARGDDPHPRRWSSARRCACCRSRSRWSPPALTFGVLALFGGSLTMASIAVLPILIGLAVDYAIQFQARFAEARPRRLAAGAAAVEAAARGGPVIGTAALATAAGFLVLLLSPIPMIRGFGVLLVVGIAIAFVLALTAGLALLSLTGRAGERAGRPAAGLRAGSRGVRRRQGRGRAAPDGGGSAAAGRWRLGRRARAGAGGRARARRRRLGGRHAGRGDLRPARARPAATCRSCRTSTSSRSDRRLGRGRRPVRAPDLTDPAVVAWMSDFKQRVLDGAGFGGEPTCAAQQDAQICPVRRSPTSSATSRRRAATGSRGSSTCCRATSRPRSSAATRPTRQPGDTAVIPFGIKVMPFDEQKQLIDSIRSEIDPPGTENDPPAGVSAEVVGLPVLAADANSALSANRYLLTLAGLAAVALALLRGLPLGPPGARAADPDRARDRLVVARPRGRRASRSTRCRRPSARW